MQEEAIHFVSVNVMRSYLEAISSRACSRQDHPGCFCRNGRRTFQSVAASTLKPNFGHLCRFRCLQIADRESSVWDSAEMG
ncbi:hypothetical protein CEXT_110851 [Caerostris extrusa]|uniref:Uncharacterized protein n=1 Tax=Caerostris extrusa TaxID=172846 RepID=A0AAV4W7Z5_CAEEX|nr:hypothetical protein CEXT_110851 [Caerostris extrusa]